MGNFTNAYSDGKSTNISLSGLANDVRDTGFRYRQEKRINDEIARLAKEAEDKRKDDLEAKYAEMKKINPTGIRVVDEAMVVYVNQALDKRLEFHKKELRGERLTPEEVVLNKRLQNLPDTLSMMVKSLDDQDSQYLELTKKGDNKRDYDYEAKKMKMASGSIPFLDKDFNPVIGFDNDGDGKPEIVTFDLNQGFNLKPRLIPNVDENKVIENTVKTLKEKTNTTDWNFVKQTVTGLPMNDANQAAKNLIYSGEGLSPMTISHFWDAGIKDPSQISEKQLQDYQKEIATRLIAGLPRGTATNINYNAKIAASKEAREAKKENEEKPVIGEVVDSEKATWGLQYAQIGKGYKTVPVTGKLEVNNIPVKNLGGKKGIKGNVSNAQVEAFTFDGKGNMLVNFSYELPVSKDKKVSNLKIDSSLSSTDTDYADDSTSKKERASEQVKVSKATASFIASRLGKTIEEAKKLVVGEADSGIGVKYN